MKQSSFILILLILLNPFLGKAQSVITRFALPQFTIQNSIVENQSNRSFLKVAPTGEIWIGFSGGIYQNYFVTSEYGAASFDGKTWKYINKSNSPIPSNCTVDIEFDDQTIWLATKGGLAKKSGNNWSVYRKSNTQIISDSINDIHICGGKLWIATNAGVSVLYKEQFTNYTVQNGLNMNKVNCIENTHQGELVFGTDSGIAVFNPATGEWKKMNRSNSGFKANKVYTLKTDIYNQVWIGSDSMLVDSTDYYPAVYILRDGVIKPLTETLSECTVRSDRLPYNTRDFATRNGKTVFMSSTRKYEDFRLLLEYKQQKIKQYDLIKLGLRQTYSDYLFAYDNQDNIWFMRYTGGYGRDSIYKFSPPDYPFPEQDPKVLSYLEVNKVKTPILGWGDMFWNLQYSGYEVPKGTCKTALFAGSTWFGGLVNKDLKISAQTYRQQGTDFLPGPLKIGSASTNDETREKFSRFWNLSRYQIEEFKRNYANGKVADGTFKIPRDILEWPALGDTVSGYAKKLAPFYDADQDGMYNPINGDYPLIKGDQMVYWIYNDSPNRHGESGGRPLGIEIHGSAYAFACNTLSDIDSGSAINYTTFYNLKIYNRSNYTIDSFITGLWFEPDIGYYNDDYIGSNPKEDYAFCYNGDDYDEFGSGYGINPPAIATVLLKGLTNEEAETVGRLSGVMSYENNSAYMGSPVFPNQFWNILNHRWKTGEPLTYGGSGYKGTDTASFVFPQSDDLAGRSKWSEETAQMKSGDRRYIMLIGPAEFKSNTALTLDYAVVYSRSDKGGAWASVEKLKSDVTRVKEWFKINQFPTCYDDTKNGMLETDKATTVLTLYPNPVNDHLQLKSNARVLSGARFSICNSMGMEVKKGVLDQTGQVNVAELIPGMYFIQVKTPLDNSCTRFVVIR